MNTRSHSTPFRQNKYPGYCQACGNRVPAKAGLLMGRNDRGRWIVSHNRCVPDDEWTAAADAAWAAFDDPQR